MSNMLTVKLAYLFLPFHVFSNPGDVCLTSFPTHDHKGRDGRLGRKAVTLRICTPETNFIVILSLTE